MISRPTLEQVRRYGRGHRHHDGMAGGLSIDVYDQASNVGPPPAFAGAWATLFPGAFQVVQTDLGLTYGGTPLATAGNTSTTVLTLTGTLATVPVPIWAVATNTLAIGSGAQFNIYYDGLGVTPAMVGVTPAVATPVALTGAATGLFLAWSAGASVSADSWKATCAGLADQSGNTKDYSQATASKQPVITVGLNGKPGLLADGVNDTLVSLLNMPAPATTPWTLLAVMQNAAGNSSTRPLGSSSANSPGFAVTGTGFSQTGAGNIGAGWSTAQYSVITAYFSGTTSDSLKIGSNSIITGSAASGGATTGREIFSSVGAAFTTFQLLALIYVPGNVSDVAFRAAVNSAAGYGVGNVLV